MLASVTACQRLVTRTAQLHAEGKLGDHHAALSKAFCTARMRETVAWAREILGGTGILTDYNWVDFPIIRTQKLPLHFDRR
jgi:alkylation response protein AidB-like acyl-CoA dehydrogenase